MIEGARPSISFRRPDGEWTPVEGVTEVSRDARPLYSGTIEATIEQFTISGTVERYTITRSRNFVRRCARGRLSTGARFTLIDGWSTRVPRRLRRRERKRRGKA